MLCVSFHVYRIGINIGTMRFCTLSAIVPLAFSSATKQAEGDGAGENTCLSFTTSGACPSDRCVWIEPACQELVDNGSGVYCFDNATTCSVNTCCAFAPKDKDKLKEALAFYFEPGGEERYPHINDWDVSKVTSMKDVFRKVQKNMDISDWNTAQVTSMSGMFERARRFNRKLGTWNVGNVTDMSGMFKNAPKFNGDLNAWNVDRVTDMGFMFEDADAFNGDLSAWSVGNVMNMTGMFSTAKKFNSDLTSWNVSQVTTMSQMFSKAKQFNSGLSAWNVQKVTSMGRMFNSAESFNSDLGAWNVSNVINMENMFSSALTFNADLNAWNMAQVTNTESMFMNAKSFNHSLSDWNLAQVVSSDLMWHDAHDMSSPKPTGGCSTVAQEGYEAISCNKNIAGATTVFDCEIVCARGYEGKNIKKRCFASRTNVPSAQFYGCDQCPPGTYENSSECQNCEAGTKSMAGDTFCTPCAAGRYSAKKSSDCTSCPSGMYARSGAPACSPCGAGKAPTKSRDGCGQCKPGKHAKAGDASCEPCAEGHIPDSLQRDCIACEAGEFAGTGDPVCQICESGRVPNGKRSACVGCEVGTIAMGGKCSPCEAGQVTSADQSQCILCAGGNTPNKNKAVCDDCPLGTYARSGDAQCSLCEAGKEPSPYKDQCDPCPSGERASPGSESCEPCKSGHVPDANQSGCTTCEAGKFAGHGDSACQICETGQFAPAGSKKCHQCNGSAIPDTAQEKCTNCAVFRRADSTNTVCVLNMPVILAGLGAAVALGLASIDAVANLRLRKTGKCIMTVSGGLHPVDDIWTDADRVMMKTVVPRHGLSNRGSKSFPVALVGTGLGRQISKQLRARVTDSRTLQLLDQNGFDLTEACEASKGFITLPLCRALLHQGWPLPLLVQIPFLILLAILLLLFSPIRAREAALFLILPNLGLMLKVLLVIKFPPRSQIQRSIKTFLKDLETKPVATLPGHSRAINIAKLRMIEERFMEFLRHRNMYYVEPNIVKPLTARWKLSLADVLGASPVLWFVSHWWGNGFGETMKALSHHAGAMNLRTSERQLLQRKSQCAYNYWICTFSNNQWQLDEEIPGRLEDSSFFKTLHSGFCEGVCMILDESATPLTRSWCLFEYLHAVELSESHRFENFCGLLFCHSSGVLNHGSASVDVSLALGKCLGHLRLEDATASQEEDKNMIDELVVTKMGSFENINAKLRSEIQNAVKTARDKSNANFLDLEAELAGEDCKTEQPHEFAATAGAASMLVVMPTSLGRDIDCNNPFLSI